MIGFNLLELILLISWKTIVKRLIKVFLWYSNNNTNKVNQKLLTQHKDVHGAVPLRRD